MEDRLANFMWICWLPSFPRERLEAVATRLMREARGSREPRPSGRIDHYVLGFGQDLSGEVYVLVSESTGPTGNTGKVFKLVRPSG
jgi:hypothetical protein